MVQPIRTRPSFPLSQSLHQEAPISLLSFSIKGQTENHNHRKLTNLITWTTALSNSMKLWVMPCRATQDRWVMVESSDKTWSTGEGNGKALHYSCLKNPMNNKKRKKDMTLEDEPPRLVGVQYATREEWRNSSRKNEEAEAKQKRHPVIYVFGAESKVWFHKEQYSIKNIKNGMLVPGSKVNCGQAEDDEWTSTF